MAATFDLNGDVWPPRSSATAVETVARVASRLVARSVFPPGEPAETLLGQLASPERRADRRGVPVLLPESILDDHAPPKLDRRLKTVHFGYSWRPSTDGWMFYYPEGLVHLDDVAEDLGRLAGLVNTLILSSGPLARPHVLSPAIARLNELVELRLPGCGITGLPDEFRELDLLVSLDLSRNPLQILPTQLAALDRLEELILQDCDQLHTDCRELTPIAGHLEHLDLGGCPVVSLDADFMASAGVICLHLRPPPGRGAELPFVGRLAPMRTLRSLEMTNARLVDPEATLGGLPGLRELSLIGVPLATLPYAACQMTRLTRLNLWDTGLSVDRNLVTNYWPNLAGDVH